MNELTALELRAEKALQFSAFPLNLRDIREKVKQLLSETQRYGFFNEYTTHSFEHVLGMLETATWIIPKDAKELLSDGDYLFITLAIYFHDIGLLISNAEFKSRDRNTEFQKYLAELYQVNSKSIDFIAQLDNVDSTEKDRILYQEFVRKTHGTRVKSWIEGYPLDDDNASEPIRSAIQGLLGKLDITIRKDLALVCESHTIDDISDTQKYKVSRPYGDSKNETVNLQYAAIILRTVDLLQITKKRAPSVLYQVIAPTDPISQVEWQKQGAVRSVRPAPGKDREGNASDSIPPNTIEVHALFEKSDGFFGLTSYLSYVNSQLNACQEAIKRSEKLLTHPIPFPWKYVDDSCVEAQGFLTDAFGFELDQQKILDLLTGHTLYNDTDVVIRELTQNALDAVRLQSSIDGCPSESSGRIDIKWNSSDKILEVTDNGTGMSQEVIESHLLKVGSSRYQDPKFREKHPDFSSISRFGIGVLSAFMVADSVEITTCSPDDEKARNISLRSVHGKYLIKLLDKVSDRQEIGVYPHGSRIKLTLRSSAVIGDVLSIAKMWLLFPRCSVYVTIDNEEPVKVGFDSPKSALQHYIDTSTFKSRRRNAEYEIREVTENGLTLAYAVKRDELFNDWSFITLEERFRYPQADEEEPLVVTCVEGVGVKFTTPGFESSTILAIANIIGKNAPKTNVARSALEETTEYTQALKQIYKIYTKHISKEIDSLSKSADYSLSRAVDQAPYIATPLTSNSGQVTRNALLEEELASIPLIISEEKGNRQIISLKDLQDKEQFWTVNSPLMSSVEFFVREAPKNISATMLLENLKDDKSTLPTGVTVCNYDKSSILESAISRIFEPYRIEANQKNRSISLLWKKIESTSRWISSNDIMHEVAINDRELWSALSERNEYRHRPDSPSTKFAVQDVEIINLEDHSELIANKQIYLNPSDPISALLKETWDSNNPQKTNACACYITILGLIRAYAFSREEFNADWLDRIIINNRLSIAKSYIEVTPFVAAVRSSNNKCFNPFAWTRRDSEEK